jgi:hypothetical protein
MVILTANRIAATRVSYLDYHAKIHQDRIIADGGTITDIQLLSDFIRSFKAIGCYELFNALYLGLAIRKDDVNKVSKIYDLSVDKSGSYYDCDQTTAVLQQTWVDNQLDNFPVISFSSSNGGYTGSTMATIGQPYTLFSISRKDGGGSSIRNIMQVASASTTGPNFRYDGNTTSVSIGGLIPATTAQSTYAQLTFLSNGASSSIRRKGSELSSGNGGSTTASSPFIALGMNRLGTDVHNGIIAFAGLVRQSLTTQQRDDIENLLNTKYFPSTV